jgi:hypothetical protein
MKYLDNFGGFQGRDLSFFIYNGDVLLTVCPVQTPVAGMLLKRNIMLAFIVHFCVVSIFGWSALESIFKFLAVSVSSIILHAATRRPAWLLHNLYGSNNRRWLPAGITYFSKQQELPLEGLRPLIGDCQARLCRVSRRFWRYFRGWCADMGYAMRFKWHHWLEAVRQRRARRAERRRQAALSRRERSKKHIAPLAVPLVKRGPAKNGLEMPGDDVYL